MAIYTALFDANVLYSLPVTDIIVELASRGLFRARWSEAIHDEWMERVAKNRLDLPADVVRRRRTLMDIAVPEARVTGYEHLIARLRLPDPNDRHVLAAAIVGRADVIVTFNLRDFPPEQLAPFAIEVQHPDEFLNYQRTLNERLFLACIKAIRARLSKPKYEPDAYVEHLRECQMKVLAAELEKVKSLI